MGESDGVPEHATKFRPIFHLVRWFQRFQSQSVPKMCVSHVMGMKVCSFLPQERNATLALCFHWCNDHRIYCWNQHTLERPRIQVHTQTHVWCAGCIGTISTGFGLSSGCWGHLFLKALRGYMHRRVTGTTVSFDYSAFFFLKDGYSSISG